jgi:outer membrane lipoprotein
MRSFQDYRLNLRLSASNCFFRGCSRHSWLNAVFGKYAFLAWEGGMAAGKQWLMRFAWLAMALAGAAFAAPPAPDLPTRRDTLARDLFGPAVDWTGQILAALRDDGDTCFVLRQTADETGYAIVAIEPFIACAPGLFDPAVFSVGRELEVRGNLGAAMPRRIGGTVFSYPVVAGAFITPAPPRPRYYWPPPGYYDPFYDPYYGPRFHPRPWPPYYRPW